MLTFDRQTMARRGLATGARMALLALILLLLALGLNASATNAQAESDGGGVLLFTRLANGQPGGEGFYLINADGTGERPLALFSDIGYPYDLEDGGYRCPAWSPDGTRIAFNGAFEGESYLAVMDADGSNAQTIYRVQNDDTVTHHVQYPRWVPNSDRLSFAFTDFERKTGLFIANGVRSIALDGSDVQTVRGDITMTYPTGEPMYYDTMMPNFSVLNHSWSPDGQQLAIASYNGHVYLTDAAGSSLRELESSQWSSGAVDWSPDGGLLAMSLRQIVVAPPDDSDARVVVPFPPTLDRDHESLTWSPDGTQLAFTTTYLDISSGEGLFYFTLIVVDVATGEQREILRTPHFGRNDYPYNFGCVDWRPAGTATAAVQPADSAFATNTPAPTKAVATATPVTCTLQAPQNVNLRAQPDADSALAGSIPRGTSFEVDGWTDADDYHWFHLPTGEWVRGDVVSVDEAACAALPPRTHSGGLAG